MVTLGLLALGWAGPAAARPHSPRPPQQVNVALTGALTIAWTGNPAGGCAPVGVCGVHGALDITLGNGQASSSGGPVPLEANDPNAVVRVQSTAPDGTVIPCSDLVPVDFTFAVAHSGGDLHAGIDSAGSFQLPSSGRCAGPTAADMARITLPARRMGAHGYDLSGQTSIAAGPFQVTAISTVKAHITYGSQGGGPGVGAPPQFIRPPKPHTVLEEIARVIYRVAGFTGALTTDFAGVAPPVCDTLGTCGASGRLTQTFTARGTLEFVGTRLVTRRGGRGAALVDLARGRMHLFDTFSSVPIRGTVSETSAQTGSAPCADTSTAALPNVGSDRPRRGTDDLRLSVGQFGFGPGQSDPFRTRCAGPSGQDVLGRSGGTLAQVRITAGQLGARRLALTFQGAGAFGGAAYAGRRSGSLTLSLTLVRAGGETRRVRLFAGEPGVPFP